MTGGILPVFAPFLTVRVRNGSLALAFMMHKLSSQLWALSLKRNNTGTEPCVVFYKIKVLSISFFTMAHVREVIECNDRFCHAVSLFSSVVGSFQKPSSVAK